MAALIVEVLDTERNLRQSYTFGCTPIRLGRSPLNDLPLDRPFVSHCHGVLHFDQRRCRFVDLGSTNGTFLDRRPLPKNQPVTLAPEAVLAIGSLELRVRQADPASESQASYAFQASSMNHEPLAAVSSEHEPRPYALPEPGSLLAQPVLARDGEPANRRPPLETLPERLTPLYARYRASWAFLFSALAREAPYGTLQEQLAAQLAQRFPELEQEAEFRRWRSAVSEREHASGPPPAAAPQLGFPRRLGLPEALANDPRLFARGAQALERFAQAFIELRRGQRQAIAELGLPHPAPGPLDLLEDPSALIAHLLDPNAAAGRVDELSRAYADLMLHQVALLNAFAAGAHELLDELAPAAIAPRRRGALTWILRALGRDPGWDAYRKRHDALQQDCEMTRVLFGRAFGRAYAAAIGRGPAPAGAPELGRSTPPSAASAAGAG